MSADLETHDRNLLQLNKAFISVLRLSSFRNYTTLPVTQACAALLPVPSQFVVVSASSSELLAAHLNLVVGPLPVSSWGKFFSTCLGGGSAQSTTLFSDSTAVRAFEHTYASLLLNQRDIFRSSSIENMAFWYNRRHAFHVTTLTAGAQVYASWSPLATPQTIQHAASPTQEVVGGTSVLWRSSSSEGAYYGLAPSGVISYNPLSYSDDLQALRVLHGDADVFAN